MKAPLTSVDRHGRRPLIAGMLAVGVMLLAACSGSASAPASSSSASGSAATSAPAAKPTSVVAASSSPVAASPAASSGSPTTGSSTSSVAAQSSPVASSASPAASSATAAKKANANTASIPDIQAALEANGVPNAARWAREVDEYRPYPTDDPNMAKLRQNLAKYNPAPDVVEKIIASLTLS